VNQLHPENARYPPSLFGLGIKYLRVKNSMEAAVRFCKKEARDGQLEIVSVGSRDGSVERMVNAAYRQRYPTSSDLNFVLVDPDPRFDGLVGFDYMDDLIEKHPTIVGNCVLYVI